MHMSAKLNPILIIGQGLAGSALALAFRKRSQEVVVVNDPENEGASRVAAGLITTLAGRSMNPAWRQEAYLPEALQMYRELEQQTNESFLEMMPIIRPFESTQQKEKFDKKKEQKAQWLVDNDEIPNALHADFGYFTMKDSGRLDTVKYLDVIRELLGSDYLSESFNENELKLIDNGVLWKDKEYSKVIYCNGIESFSSKFWSMIPNRSAKGEMLTVKFERLDDKVILSRNGWIVPLGDGVWKTGATYTRGLLDAKHTKMAQREIMEKIEALVDSNYEVIQQSAGVRPIVNNSIPVIGLHHEYPQIGIFNGLGSRGVMTAPSVAKHFVEVILDEAAIDPELSYQRTQ